MKESTGSVEFSKVKLNGKMEIVTTDGPLAVSVIEGTLSEDFEGRSRWLFRLG